MQPQAKPKISNVEWGLIFGATIVLDLCQLAIDLIPGVGEIINAFIDIFVAFALAFYFYMRGIITGGMIFTMVVGFLFKEGTLSIVPWTIEIAIIYFIQKAAETKGFQDIANAAGKVAGGSKIAGKVVKYVAPEAAGALNKIETVKTQAEKVQQAALAVQSNQAKINTNGGNFFDAQQKLRGYANTALSQNRITQNSPRMAQIAAAKNAAQRNDVKKQAISAQKGFDK